MAGAAAPAAERVDVSAKLAPSRIHPDQEAALEITVTYPGEGRALALEAPILPPLDGLRVARRSVSTETRWDASGAATVVRYAFSLVPEKTGTVPLDSVRVSWTGGAGEVGGSRVTSAGVLRVVKRPPVIGTLIRHPVRSSGGIALLALGAVVLAWLWRRRKSAEEVQVSLGPAETLERDWRRLRDLARRGALGPFSDESSRAVRRFVRERYGIPADRLPTPGVIGSLEAAGAPGDMAAAVRGVLTFVDDMRFGLWVPTHPELEIVLGEIERIWVAGRAVEALSQGGGRIPPRA